MKIGNLGRVIAVVLATFVLATISAMPADAKARNVRKAKVGLTPWHGWVVNSPVAIYHEGIRYAGGTPKGPAMWYNNGQGGFNAKLFWTLYDRHAPG
jgi:hypothetical protein